MSVLHDYQCKAHGIFESMTGRCPHGCVDSFVDKVFLKAPGGISGATRAVDKNLGSLAADYTMSNMSNRGGAVGNPHPESEKRVRETEKRLSELAPTWGTVGKEGNAIQEAISAHNATPGNALAQVKDVLTGPKPLVVGASGSKADIARA